VVVVKAKPGAALQELLLPGDCMADRASDLFARTNGYLKSWAVDIGDRVKAGQALCTIETPELDEELHQAEAALAQSRAHVVTAQANSKLTAITLKRYSELRDTKVISEQDYSERLAADESAQAELEAARADALVAEANLRRLTELRSFETMVAPYDGVISARNTEIGALVTAGSGPGAKALFSIARTDVLRIFVDVPQTPALAMKNGQEVSILAREYPKRPFAGQVSRNAGVIDPTSRTLRVEIRVPNEEGLLLAGMYVQVSIKVPQAAPPLLVPGSTLVFNSEGNQLALVRDGHVHFQAVTVSGDFGKEVGISAGLQPGDQIIANPSSQLVEGALVEAVPGH
jgi:RND family efflux transporter MFP subunit